MVWTSVLELPPGMPEISPSLVTVVPGTAVAKDIPTRDTIYPKLCETL